MPCSYQRLSYSIWKTKHNKCYIFAAIYLRFHERKTNGATLVCFIWKFEVSRSISILKSPSTLTDLGEPRTRRTRWRAVPPLLRSPSHGTLRVRRTKNSAQEVVRLTPRVPRGALTSTFFSLTLWHKYVCY